jgi:hypothetical protein
MKANEDVDLVGMWELLEAIEAVIKAADPAKRKALAQTIDDYSSGMLGDEFLWAVGPQSPSLLFHLMNSIDAACRPDEQSKVRPPIRLVTRAPDGIQ